jgi:hypothetical protein
MVPVWRARGDDVLVVLTDRMTTESEIGIERILDLVQDPVLGCGHAHGDTR